MKLRVFKHPVMRLFGFTLVALVAIFLAHEKMLTPKSIESIWTESSTDFASIFENKKNPILAFPNEGRADLAVQFFGVSTLSVCAPAEKPEDNTCVLLDGFFSRPSFAEIATRKLVSDQKKITWALERAHFKSIEGIFVGHSHYDHLLDTSQVARRYAANVYGSPSTAHVVRAEGIPESSIKVIKNGQVIDFEKLNVTILSALHSPDSYFPGQISADFSPPARVSAYREGGCFAFAFGSGTSKILIVPSANVPNPGYTGIKAQAVFLGVGALGTRDENYIENYWQKAVKDVDAKEVVLIHWDDFTKPLTIPLQPLPKAFDDFEYTLRVLSRLAKRDEVRLQLPVAFQSFYYKNGEE
ncbi:MAG: hypothetical protein RL189_1855 [Pseudomonadota bacterium]